MIRNGGSGAYCGTYVSGAFGVTREMIRLKAVRKVCYIQYRRCRRVREETPDNYCCGMAIGLQS